MDVNLGYWRLPLDEESQRLTTFITPFRGFCPTRRPYGLASMSKIFNKRIDKIIEGPSRAAKSMDDFVILGNAIKENNERLKSFLWRLEEFEFRETETKF